MAQQERIIKATRDMKTEDVDQQQAVRRQRPLLRAPDSAEVSRSQISIDAIYPGPMMNNEMALYEKYNSIAQKTASIKTFGSLNQSRHQDNHLAQRDEAQRAENANQIENEDQGNKLQ